MLTDTRRTLPALAAVIACAAALAFSPAHAGPTEAELAAAVLTTQEVGTGFTVARKGSVDTLANNGLTNYAVAYQRAGLRGFDVVLVGLTDVSSAPDAEAADVSDLAAQLKDLGITLTPASPPAIGEDTEMWTVSGSLFGAALGGEVLVWRHGSVKALVAAVGTGNPTAHGYAEKQETKLGSLGF